MAGTKRQEVSIGERAKGVVQAKNASRKEAKEAKVAEKEAHPGLPGERNPCAALRYAESDH